MTDSPSMRSPADVPDLTVVEFLRARLDEAARAAERMRHYNPDDGLVYSCPATRTEPLGDLPWGEGACDCGLAERKARVLRDVAAKRRIVDLHDGSHECSSHGDNCTWIDGDVRPHCDTVALLAEVYDQHPDYNERWRP